MSKEFSYHSNKEVSKVYDISRAMSPFMVKAWKDKIYDASYQSDHLIRKVIDLWCWTWRFIPLLIEALDQVSITWLEPSEHMIKQAIEKKYEKEITFIKNGIEYTWLKDNEFDFAFMSMVYHHIPKKENAALEVKRILKKWWIFFIRNSTKETLLLEPWIKYFPSALKVELDRACTRNDITDVFRNSWLSLISFWTVQQVSWINWKVYFDKISKRWLSSLQSIKDEDFQIWLDKMKEITSIDKEFLEPVDYFVFKK